MKFLKDIQIKSSTLRLSEELLYEQVTNELANGVERKGLMAKAMADAGGDPDRTQALYIKYRVRSIRDEMELTAVVREKEEQEATARREAERVREQRKKENEMRKIALAESDERMRLYRIKSKRENKIIAVGFFIVFLIGLAFYLKNTLL